ncbi:alpha/beta hydrolase [Streptomyces sp. NPDC091292]|uniref:alpha/beta hydrolase n=1 Tax=Streptomyces sp. NPDC091292 TaxID=3365991 RepID=UPI003821E5F0
MPVTRLHRRIDVSAALPEPAGHHVAADLFLPAGSPRPLALCCLSGGGASKRYWDITPESDDTGAGKDESFSFAAVMAGAGYPVLSVDHLGTGDSILPQGAPPPLLGQVLAANHLAFQQLLGELREQIPGLRSVGVGHSMGSTLTIRQQDRHPTHTALALLGFSTAGLPAVLPPDILAAVADGPPGDEELAALAVRMFGAAYTELHLDDPEVPDVINGFRTASLSAGGLLSLLPGNVAAEVARLSVPVFLANGEKDTLTDGGPDPTPYRSAPTVTSFTAPGTGHNLLLGSARRLLWERLLDWLDALAPAVSRD